MTVAGLSAGIGGELQLSFALFLRFFSLAAQKAMLGALRASGIFATIIVDYGGGKTPCIDHSDKNAHRGEAVHVLPQNSR